MEIYLVGSRGRWPYDARQSPPTHGAMLEYVCLKDEHRIEGPRFTYCIEGHWSPDETPNCTKITHGIIPTSWLFYMPWFITFKLTDSIMDAPIMYNRIAIVLCISLGKYSTIYDDVDENDFSTCFCCNYEYSVKCLYIFCPTVIF